MSYRPLLATFVITSTLVSACAGDGQTVMSPAAPTMETVIPTATLMVEVDKICGGQENNIRVFIDAVQIGVTNPGEPGVSRMVTVGSHQLSARSERGTMWGPFPTLVAAAGQLERLGCMPAAGL
jgi:hypothetical protein